jgi:hypothetical protein
MKRRLNMSLLKRLINKKSNIVSLNDIKRGDVYIVKINSIKFVVVVLIVNQNGLISCAQIVNINHSKLDKQNALELKIDENSFYLPVGCINQINVKCFECKCGEVNDATLIEYRRRFNELLTK